MYDDLRKGKVMKDHLISFACGLLALGIVAAVVYAVMWLFGKEALVIGLFLIVIWGVGNSIRETIKEMKEANE
mgnify:CR=1 FL=1